MRLLEQVLVAERPHDGMFATVCTVGVAPGRSEVIVLSAGNPAPLRRHRRALPALAPRRPCSSWLTRPLSATSPADEIPRPWSVFSRI